MSDTNIKRSLAAITICLIAVPPRPAWAYNKDGHLEITDSAWQIMRAASSTTPSGPEVPIRSPGTCATSPGLCGSTVTQAQWTAFLARIDKARRVIGAQHSEVPNATVDVLFANGPPIGSDCFTGGPTTQVAKFTAVLSARHYWRDGDNTQDCGVYPGYSLPPFYAGLTVPADGEGKQGRVLGWHAKHRDDDLGETTLQVAPYVVGPLLDVFGESWEQILGAVFIPFVCGYLALFGDDDNCDSRARELANDTNPFDLLKSFVPGLFERPQEESYIGFWHHINVRDSDELLNYYDDKQGYAPSWGGPEQSISAIEQAVILGSELLWVTLDAADSTGDDRYEINTSSDGHEASEPRGDGEWQEESIGDQQFSPLDNLAYYGFHNASLPLITRLGWPLHAIGDATVPHHVVATAGHGHRPYENWIDANVRYLTKRACPPVTSCTAATLQQEQISQAHRVLQIAYRWRKYLETNGIRNFITALAEDTLNSFGDDTDAWPFCDVCSSFDAINEGGFEGEGLQILVPEVNIEQGYQPEDLQTNPTIFYDGKEAQVQPLVESAMGAKIALLVYAAETIIPACIPNNRYGCLSNADCCTAGHVCTSSNTCQNPLD